MLPSPTVWRKRLCDEWAAPKPGGSRIPLRRQNFVILHDKSRAGRNRPNQSDATDARATQQTLERLLVLLESSEQDRFASRIYQSRREYRLVCQRSGKGNKQIERCIISTFRVAESMGFKGEFRHWQHLLRVGD
jgi:hypothetical protein